MDGIRLLQAKVRSVTKIQGCVLYSLFSFHSSYQLVYCLESGRIETLRIFVLRLEP